MSVLRSRQEEEPVVVEEADVADGEELADAVLLGLLLVPVVLEVGPSRMAMYTVPIWLASSRLPSSSKMAISEIGHGLPTVPGLVSHSSVVTSVPPPSEAA